MHGCPANWVRKWGVRRLAFDLGWPWNRAHASIDEPSANSHELERPNEVSAGSVDQPVPTHVLAESTNITLTVAPLLSTQYWLAGLPHLVGRWLHVSNIFIYTYIEK
jgi:hypothetical protein